MTLRSKAGQFVNTFTAMDLYVSALEPASLRTLVNTAAPTSLQAAMQHAERLEEHTTPLPTSNHHVTNPQTCISAASGQPFNANRYRCEKCHVWCDKRDGEHKCKSSDLQWRVNNRTQNLQRRV